jgi:hypothetical protein
MSQQPPDRPPHPSPAQKRERTAEDVMWGRVERKRERIRTEIMRNRAGGHRIPTWVLAVVLGLLVIGWAYLIFTN